MQRLYTLFILFFISISLHSYGQIVERTHSSVFITPKLGVTFSDADISTKYRWGAGLDFGATLAKYKKVEFDLRGDLLLGVWKGQNYRNSYLGDYTGDEESFSSDALMKYKNELGYTVRNYRAINGQVSLNGVLRFNVDAQRRWFPYLFGGIGVSIYGSKSDMLQKNGDIYQYEPDFIPESKSYYNKIQDGIYETNRIFGETTTALTGNFGFGIGYNVNDGIRVGLEHKISFLNKDNFDGYVANKKALRNDLYHFTSVYVQFYLKPYKRQPKQPTPPVVSQPPVNQPQQPCYAPSIYFNNPNSNGQIINNGTTYSFDATLREVRSKNNISVNYNGTIITNYSFNASSGRLTFNAPLKEGINSVTITVVNDCGRDEQSTYINNQIVRQPDNNTQRCDDPVISYNKIPNDRLDLSNPKRVISGYVYNVTSKNQITMYVNGVKTTNFTFNATTHQFSVTVTPINGQNTIQVMANNNCGSAQQGTNFNEVLRTPNPPTVNFTTPNKPGTTVSNSNYTFIAKTTGITSKNQIQVDFNGINVTNFTFNAATAQITYQVTLIEGNNTSMIKVQNNDGSDMTLTNVLYRNKVTVDCKDPEITFNQPLRIGNEDAQRTVSGIIKNVMNKNQITMMVNNQTTTNFTFAPITGAFSITFNAIEGVNTVKVIASNDCGKTQASTNVDGIVKTPPTVHFTTPSQPGTTAISTPYTFIAQTTNITNKNQIQVQFNGASVTDFTFNANASTVSFTKELIAGNNTAYIHVQNNDGSDVDNTNILFKPAAPCVEPIITLDRKTGDQLEEYSEENTRTVSGTILNITSANQIKIYINNQLTNDFTFNPSTGKFSVTFSVGNGNTNIKVTATNECGSNEKDTNINTSLGTGNGGLGNGGNNNGGDRGNAGNNNLPAPTVGFTTPSAPRSVINVNTYNFVAKTTNVVNARRIQVKLNGTPVTDFIFNAANGTVTFNKQLNSGVNTAEITVQHPTNEAHASTTIIYKKAEVAIVPTLKWITPNQAGIKSVVNTFDFSAKATNVSNKNQLTVTINNTNFTNFTYNATTGNISFKGNLNEGTNTVKITANVNGKTVTISTTVIYSPISFDKTPIKTPGKVTIKEPEILITSHGCPAQLVLGNNQITGYVSNVNNINQVTITLDGAAIPGIQITQQGDKVLFSFKVAARSNMANQTLKIVANNGISKNKTCTIQYPGQPQNKGENNNQKGKATGKNVKTIKTPPTKIEKPNKKEESGEIKEIKKTGNIRGGR